MFVTKKQKVDALVKQGILIQVKNNWPCSNFGDYRCKYHILRFILFLKRTYAFSGFFSFLFNLFIFNEFFAFDEADFAILKQKYLL